MSCKICVPDGEFERTGFTQKKEEKRNNRTKSNGKHNDVLNMNKKTKVNKLGCITRDISASSTKGARIQENAEANIMFTTFSFPLSANLPPSFESAVGYIRYYIAASVTLVAAGDQKRQIEVVSFISVNSQLNLNHCAKANVGMIATVNERMMCSCFAMGPVHAMVLIPRRGFVCGESIPINAEITNMTRTAITHVTLQLVQVARFGRYRFGRHKQSVAKSMRGVILGHSRQVWNNEMLRIPAVVTTNQNVHFNISYSLRMEITCGNGSCIILKLPIIIGNVPLAQTMNTFAAPIETNQLAHSTIVHHLYQACYLSQKRNASEFVPSYVTYVVAAEEPVELFA